MTPGRAVRKFCIECVGGEVAEVKVCGGDKCLNGGCDLNNVCLFYPYRMGRGRPSVKLIRKICLWCQGDSRNFVATCPTSNCALHAFRMGKNPNISEKTRNRVRTTLKRTEKIETAEEKTPKFERSAPG